MHIALVTTSWPVDEADPCGHFVRSHARELERKGHRITLLTPPAGGAFGWPGVAARLRERPDRALDAARWVLSATLRLRNLEVDRIVAHWAVPSAWPIAWTGAVPLEIVSHGGDVRLVVALPITVRSFVAHALSERAASWTFPSEALLNHLLASLERESRARVERIAIVRPPPIEMPDVAAAIARLKIDLAGKRVAVCVGRLVPSKRVDRAIAYVARERSFDRLIVVGDGPERGRLERMAREHPIDARFLGALGRPMALAWIGASSVLLHASEAEGLSTVVREAEALGTPVVRVGFE